MATSRRFDSKVGAERWLEREGIEGQPILLQTYTDAQGRVSREEWAIRTEEDDLLIFGRLSERDDMNPLWCLGMHERDADTSENDISVHRQSKMGCIK